MRSLICLSLGLLLAVAAIAQDINIIPLPVDIKKPGTPGSFTINPSTIIETAGNGPDNTIAFLNDYLQRFYGYKLKIEKAGNPSRKNAVVFEQARMQNIAGSSSLVTDGYELKITGQQIYISADKESGLFYGMQSLLQ